MSARQNAEILLINPGYEKERALGPFARYVTSQLPLSLGFIAGYLRACHVPVILADEQLSRLDEASLAELIERRGVMVVGITVLTLTSPRAYGLGRLIKARWPHVVVVMGGVHVTLLPEEPLELGVADVVVRGEGELTMRELSECILSGRPYGAVAGISYRQGAKAVHNADRPLVEDLDSLPAFPYDLFAGDIERYQFGNVLASRGCPYECIFCSQRAVSGRRYRSRSPQMIFRDIETLVFRYGQSFLFINDDNFLVNRAAVRELCDLVVRRGLPPHVRIGFNARGDALDEELLGHLRRAGFAFLLIGFETGSERLMALIKKGETVAQIAAGVQAAKRSGFIVGGQFILGFPTETRRESLQTIRHAMRLPIDFVRFNLLVPYPGTEVFELARREGGACSTDWSCYATHGGLTGSAAPYVPQGRGQRELVLLQWLGHLLFFLRPRQLLGIGNMRYATGGQLRIPDPRTVRGFAELMLFVLRLLRSLAWNVVRKAAWRNSCR